MPYTFTHTRLLISDYQACYTFYKEILGFEVTWGNCNTGYAEFNTGAANAGLAIFGRKAMADAIGDRAPADSPPKEQRVCLTFQVASVDEMHGKLREAGVEFVAAPRDYDDWGLRVAHFRDPDGNLIEINEPLKRT